MTKQHVVCIATALAAASASSTTAASRSAATAAAPLSHLASPTLDLAVKLCPRGGEQQEQPTGTDDDDNGDVNAPPKQDNTAKSKRRRRKKTDTAAKKPDESPRTNIKSPKTSSPKPNNTASSNHLPKSNPVFEQILKESDYYKILGVQRNDSDTAIQKAYRRKAVLTHPDKTNGDRRAFDKVAQAYDVLSDANKRQIYDRYGAEGVEQAATGGMPGAGGAGATSSSPEDLFRSFFGPAGSAFFSSSQHHHQQPPPSRNRTARYHLTVTLEDLYQGVSQKNIWIRAPADHFYHHRRGQNEKTNSRNKQVHVQIPRGACDGQCIVLSGEIDFEAADTPADLIFIIQQRPHPVFTRKGYDLAMTMPIRLKEAVCGVHRTIRHLDGRLLHVVSATAQHDQKSKATATTTTKDPIVIRTGDVQRLKGQGMPKNPQGTEFGDLYIQYEVVMPSKKTKTSLSSQEREELGRLLDKLEGYPATSSSSSRKGKVNKEKNKTKKEKEYELSPASLSDFGIASGTPHFPTMEEEEENDGFSQFGDGRFFFSSSSRRTNGASHPFFGVPPEGFPGNADENVQCRQM